MAGSCRSREVHYYFKCYSAALLNSPSQEKFWRDKKLTFSEAAARTVQAARTEQCQLGMRMSQPTASLPQLHALTVTQGPGASASPRPETGCPVRRGSQALSPAAPPSFPPSLSTYCVPGLEYRPVEDAPLSLRLPQLVVDAETRVTAQHAWAEAQADAWGAAGQGRCPPWLRPPPGARRGGCSTSGC